MKLKCSTKQLSSALHTVSRAVSMHTTLPVLNNVLLQAEDSQLKLSATNLEMSITKEISCEVRMQGNTTAPAQLLTEFVSALPTDELELELDTDNQIMHAFSEGYDTHIHCIESSEFPDLNEIPIESVCQVSANALFDAINKVLIAVASDDPRPVLMGVLFNFAEEKLVLAASDSHRLAQSIVNVENNTTSTTLIVPGKTLVEVPRALRGEDETVNIAFSQERRLIAFTSGSTCVRSRLIEGVYPNYEKLIPSSFTAKVLVERKNLERSLKIVSLFAKDKHVVRIKTKPGKVILSAITNEIGDSTAEIPAQVDGEELIIGFNAKYLLDMLSAVEEDKVYLGLVEGENPSCMWPYDHKDYIYILMPVRLTV